MSEKWSRRDVLLMGIFASLQACSNSANNNAGNENTQGSSGLGPASSTRNQVTKQLSAVDLPPYQPSPHFPEGIMSGDPDPTSVVLWTRPSSALVATGAMLTAELSSDVSFASVIKTTEMTPDAAREGSSKFLIEGLQPGSSYAYRFKIGEQVSPIGLTRTAPDPTADIEALTVGVFSCQRWTHGYFTAHADLAQQNPDFVICLGDYVYETGAADGVVVPGRTDPIQDARTLDNFRRKYELYRSDVNLQAVHRRSPLIAIPDNHDGAPTPSNDKYPGAHQAFFEKMPVRQDPTDELRTHRRFTWGRLLDLWMLDLGRYKSPGSRGSGNTDGDTMMMDPSVTYLGDDQRTWLFDGLADTKATWQLLGSSKQFSPLRIRADATVPNGGTYINLDQWDGYQAERLRVLDEVKRLGRTGVVALTGDMHWFWASDVPRDFNDPKSPAIMTDLLCGGISSSNADERIQGGAGGPQTKTLLAAFGAPNQNYARFFDGDRHGYALINFRRDGADVEYRSPLTIREPTSSTEVLARLRLDPAKPGVKLVEAAGWDPNTGLPIDM